MMQFKTGCMELDDWLKGGLPQGSILLITGPSGTMKSTLAYSILLQQAKRKRKGVHFMLEQPKENFEAHLLSMGLHSHLQTAPVVSLSSHLTIPNVVEISTVDEDFVSGRLRSLFERVQEEVEKGVYTGVVFDSLTAFSDLTLQCSGTPSGRVWIRDLFDRLRFPEGFSIFISEWNPNLPEGPEMYLADGILRTYRERTDRGTNIVLICEKMRAVDIPRIYKILDFKRGQFVLSPTKITGQNIGNLEG